MDCSAPTSFTYLPCSHNLHIKHGEKYNQDAKLQRMDRTLRAVDFIEMLNSFAVA
jgi:hypothetical protein